MTRNVCQNKPQVVQNFKDQEIGQPDQEIGQPDQEIGQPDQEIGQPDQEFGQPDQEIGQADQEICQALRTRNSAQEFEIRSLRSASLSRTTFVQAIVCQKWSDHFPLLSLIILYLKGGVRWLRP